MCEKIRVLMPSEIPSLADDFDISPIRRELNDYVEKLYPLINIQELGEWAVSILICTRSTNGIGVFKRARRYPSTKKYEVSISITIPNDEQASYGLSRVKKGFYTPLNDKFYILESDFENYNNLYDYVLDSSKRAIDLVFTKGIVCGGKKIKFQK